MKRGKIDYRLVYKIEGKFGRLADCPEEDEDLRELRRKLRVGEENRVTRTGSWREWLKQEEEFY